MQCRASQLVLSYYLEKGCVLLVHKIDIVRIRRARTIIPATEQPCGSQICTSNAGQNHSQRTTD